jgi:hypothetical protein
MSKTGYETGSEGAFGLNYRSTVAYVALGGGAGQLGADRP